MQFIAALSLAASIASANVLVARQEVPVSGPQTHTVTVGGVAPVATGMAPLLTYRPESIKAATGDMVKFVFLQKNHTVTQSTFADPCKRMEGGMDSGFMPNPQGELGVEWNMTVPTTEPLWFYCKQRTGVHCGKGMVFSINAKLEGDQTMASFKQLAIKINGTEAIPLENSPLQNIDPAAQAAPSTVTVQAGDGQAIATPTGTVPAALASASVAVGQGTTGQGDACTCHCLCGAGSFPAAAGVGSFGGFGGLLPSV